MNEQTPQQKTKPPAFVLVGLPGSGKSTWAKTHPRRFEIASTDKYIEDFAREKNITYAQAFKKYFRKSQKLMKAQVERIKKEPRPFIWDQTNLTLKERDAIYKTLHKTHEVIFVCFLVPLDVCIANYRKRQKTRDGGDVVDENRICALAKTTIFPKKGDKCEKIMQIIHPEWKRPEQEKAVG